MAMIKCPECGQKMSKAAHACPRCGHPPVAASVLQPAAGGGNGACLDERRLWSGAPSLFLITGKLFRTAIWATAAWALYRYGAQGVDWLAGKWDTFESLVASHPDLQGRWLHWGAAGILGLGILGLAITWLRLKSDRYRITSQRVAVERGIIARSVDDVDLRLVDETSYKQSILQRMLGIGTVTVRSADQNMSDLDLRGVRSPRKVRELIRREAYSQSQGSLFMRQT